MLSYGTPYLYSLFKGGVPYTAGFTLCRPMALHIFILFSGREMGNYGVVGFSHFPVRYASYASPSKAFFQYLHCKYLKLIQLVHAPAAPSNKTSLAAF